MTGATGLLGRNFLFEIIKQHLTELDTLKIFILGRSNQNESLKKRIETLLKEDGANYLNIPPDSELHRYLIDKTIQCLPFELNTNENDFSQEDLQQLKVTPIDYIFHIASLTDFRSEKAVVDRLTQVNQKGTLKLLHFLKDLGNGRNAHIGEFCYVSSAYVCGQTHGHIVPNYINLDQNFRNPYERIKLETEIMVREFCKEQNIRFRIFRPSTLCGRLIENEIGATPKFDVFYAWAAFFLAYKKRQNKDEMHSTSKRLDFPARMYYNASSSLNIIPADYAGKLMWQICKQNLEGESFHLCHRSNTPNDFFVPLLLKYVNVNSYQLTNSMPDNLSRLEKYYYKTVGKIFTPYVAAEPMQFDLSNWSSVLDKSVVYCPEINSLNFCKLLDYAKTYNFGVVQ